MPLSGKRSAAIAASVLGLAILVVALRPALRPLYRSIFRAPHPPSTGLFQNPEGLAIDPAGNLLVADQDWGRLTFFDRAGRVITAFSQVEGYHDGKGRPSNITKGCNIAAVGPGRFALVAQDNLAEIEIVDGKPRLVRVIGSEGKGPGQMDGPEGLWRDDNGDLYATDEHNRRINIFDKDGTFVRCWSVPQDPQTVMTWKDRVYVSLDKRNYIACYTRDGVEKFRIGHEALFPLFSWIMAIGAPAACLALLALRKPKAALLAGAGVLAAGGIACLGDFLHHQGEGQFRLPDFMRMSPDGKSLYVTDRANARIQVLDPDGAFKFSFGRPGSGSGELNDPKDLVFDLDGNLIVADSNNQRLQVFTPDGKPLRVIK